MCLRHLRGTGCRSTICVCVTKDVYVHVEKRKAVPEESILTNRCSRVMMWINENRGVTEK